MKFGNEEEKARANAPRKINGTDLTVRNGNEPCTANTFLIVEY